MRPAPLLISGGAGGVGHYAIQFAKARGAVVIATVSSDAKAKLARAAGADHTIDYKRENVGEQVKELTDGAGVDAVIEMDLAANAKLYPGILHARSTVVVYGTGSLEATIPAQFSPDQSDHDANGSSSTSSRPRNARPPSARSRACSRARASSTTSRSLCRFNDIVAAHEAVEQGKAIGNVVVTV